MVQTSGTMLCLVFSGWVLFRLVQAVFWLPGYLEKTGGSLYQKMEPKTPLAPQKVASSKKPSSKAKDSDDEKTTAGEEKGNEDAVEQEKMDDEEEGEEDQLPAGSKKDN
ncbi:conserved hypothetical protein [Culex quinquefasciatus]|uniref:Uncharacterized protein n=1 Tax=Culex quinquefasciatus TaxID=7176 RepID=B0XD13_CULQU|nr:conserved hypothetical protein [Culex quinquefasciatus]|eukprot:XP_001867535.1 conserved hypothetical protein [Culex quinquefasciatus]